MKSPILIPALTLPLILATAASAQQQTDADKAEIRIHRIRTVTLDGASYMPGGEVLLRSKFVHHYDERGNLTSEDVYGDDGLVVPSLMAIYTYDDKSQVIASTTGGSRQTMSWVYEGGHVSELKTLNEDGSLRERRVFKRDSQGHVLEDASYGPTGAPGTKRMYKYDSQGNNVEYAEWKADGTLSTKKVNSFNTKGNATQTVIYYGSNNQAAWKTTYAYDDHDRNIGRSEFNAAGTLVTRHVFKRGADGFVVEDSAFDAQGVRQEMTKTSYEFYPPK